MGPDSADQSFARFAKSGDPRALVQVFDATADELLHVAAYLTKNRDRAEDLVQSTFLTAIERRADFDARRRVLPWLLGILTNHARDEKRREQRSPVPSAELEVVELPKDTAEAKEFGDALTAALKELEAPYRQVLGLYLEHGWTAQKIAELNGCPSGTVRSQITRGLEQLRRLLPAGFAAGMAAWLSTGVGLAQVRGCVLAHVHSSVPTTVVAGSWVLWGLGALAVAAIVAWPVSLTNGGSADPGDATEAVARAASSVDSSSPMSDDVERTRLGAKDSHASVTLTVHYTNGDPARDMSVSIRRGDRVVIASGRTTTAGTIRFDQLPAGQVFMAVGRYMMTTRTLVAGEVHDVDLRFSDQASVEGVVVDDRGSPIEGARVLYWHGMATPDVFVELEHDDMRFFTETEADGRFRLRAPFSGGTIRVRKPGYVASKEVALAEDLATETHRFELHKTACVLSGRVFGVDGGVDGAAASHAVVGLYAADISVMNLAVDEDGAFSCGEAAAGVYQIIARNERAGTWAHGTVELFDNRSTGIELELLKTGIDGGIVYVDGNPAGGLDITAVRSQPALRGVFVEVFDHVKARSDEAGCFSVDLAPGSYDFTFGEKREHVTVSAQGRSLWHGLAVDDRFEVALRDDQGQPLEGWEVMAWESDVPSPLSAVTDELGVAQFSSIGFRTFDLVAYPSAGSAALPAIFMRDVSRELHQLELVIGVQQRPSATVRVQLVGPDGGGIANTSIMLQRVGMPLRAGLNSSVEGRFTSAPPSPGSYELHLKPHGHAARTLGPFDLSPDQDLDLGVQRWLAPASLEVSVVAAVVADVEGARVWGSGCGDLPRVGDTFVHKELPPGSETLWFASRTHVPVQLHLDLLTGKRTRRVLRPVAGVACRILAIGAPFGPFGATLTVRDTTGALVLDEPVNGFGDGKSPIKIFRAFEPGTYQMALRIGNGPPRTLEVQVARDRGLIEISID
ncbi:MAG: sigma-70 family RNA polymerase sigma factor [bacterium]|nr:sigma-70 family RNA polymerase sigma factor [bacterium]